MIFSKVVQPTMEAMGFQTRIANDEALDINPASNLFYQIGSVMLGALFAIGILFAFCFAFYCLCCIGSFCCHCVKRSSTPRRKVYRHKVVRKSVAQRRLEFERLRSWYERMDQQKIPISQDETVLAEQNAPRTAGFRKHYNPRGGPLQVMIDFGRFKGHFLSLGEPLRIISKLYRSKSDPTPLSSRRRTTTKRSKRYLRPAVARVCFKRRLQNLREGLPAIKEVPEMVLIDMEPFKVFEENVQAPSDVNVEDGVSRDIELDINEDGTIATEPFTVQVEDEVEKVTNDLLEVLEKEEAEPTQEPSLRILTAPENIEQLHRVAWESLNVREITEEEYLEMAKNMEAPPAPEPLEPIVEETEEELAQEAEATKQAARNMIRAMLEVLKPDPESIGAEILPQVVEVISKGIESEPGCTKSFAEVEQFAREMIGRMVDIAKMDQELLEIDNLIAAEQQILEDEDNAELEQLVQESDDDAEPTNEDEEDEDEEENKENKE